MKKSKRFIIWFLGAGLFIFSLNLGYLWAASTPEKDSRERSFEFLENLSFAFPENSQEVRVWIPLPASDPYQETKVLYVNSPFKYEISQDPEFGNRMFYFDIKPSPGKRDAVIKIRYSIKRKERRSASTQSPRLQEKNERMSLKGYLESRGLEMVTKRIEKIALMTTKGAEDPLKKARALYDYVLKTMIYDKSGEGWGRGDSVYACDVRKGNCTDFHSLFITLARAVQIPARFRMGIPLSSNPAGVPSGSYHCWAEFFIDGKGWIPVDISEAWKKPKKAEYFFGNLDSDRIHLTTGREILLSPRQAGDPLNYLSKPYIEVDGKAFHDFSLQRFFRDSTVPKYKKG